MPEYFFRVPEGKYCNGQGEAAELPDIGSARNEALKIWSDLTRGIATEMASASDWRMEVADSSGNVLMQIRTTVETAP